MSAFVYVEQIYRKFDERMDNKQHNDSDRSLFLDVNSASSAY